MLLRYYYLLLKLLNATKIVEVDRNTTYITQYQLKYYPNATKVLLKYYLNYLMLPKTVEVNRNIANMTQYQLKYYLNATT